MRYKVWRSWDTRCEDTLRMVHVMVPDGKDDKGKDGMDRLHWTILNMGPWQGSWEGEVINLKPHYRTLLAEQGFVVLYVRPTKFTPEREG